MARVLAIVALVGALCGAALPAQAQSLGELEEARDQAFEEWGRVKASMDEVEESLERMRKDRAQKSQQVAAVERELKSSSWAWRLIRQSKLEQARQALRSVADQVAQQERVLDQQGTLEQARRLRLIGAIRGYTDRLFEVAERALSLTPPRKQQADAMVEKALEDLPLLEDLERSKWAKREIPPLPSVEQETGGKSVEELKKLALFYREFSDEASREERKLLPEHTRLSERLERLDALAKRGIAHERLPILIQRTREALGRADDVVQSFHARAERYLARAQQIEALVAERALNEARRPRERK
ncbi:MAG: hypothetical protein R3F62_11210 [Planctomycetota bacterium]